MATGLLSLNVVDVINIFIAIDVILPNNVVVEIDVVEIDIAENDIVIEIDAVVKIVMTLQCFSCSNMGIGC